MGGGRAWGCVKAMISSDQATLLLIGTVQTLGCLPPHSNEKPWPPLVSKVTKAYCNCTFSNGVSHARTPTPSNENYHHVMGSSHAFQSPCLFGRVDASQRLCFIGCNIVLNYLFIEAVSSPACCHRLFQNQTLLHLDFKYWIVRFEAGCYEVYIHSQSIPSFRSLVAHRWSGEADRTSHAFSKKCTAVETVRQQNKRKPKKITIKLMLYSTYFL